MRSPQYQLVYKEKATGGPILRQTCDAEKQVEVVEITTRERLRLRTRDISIYRHSLVIDGKPYDILNVFELH